MNRSSGPDHNHRTIRSFVKRSGRLTTGQRHALDQYWSLYGIDYDPDKLLDLTSVFPAQTCFKLEIGFGNGESLVYMAKQDPSCGYIGIEVHDPGVGHCLGRIHDEQLQNLRIISHDAIDVLERMIPKHSLQAGFLFFPDPWPKKRHHKRRILNKKLRDLLAIALLPGGTLHMTTDWQEYAEYMAEDMFSDERFKNRGDSLGYATKPDYRPTTKFERRGRKLGHSVWDLIFERL